MWQPAQGAAEQLCAVATTASFITMLAAMFSGALILEFFKISIDAFRIAGGILLIITGINMVNSNAPAADNTGAKDKSVGYDFGGGIPIAIPLTTGAGTISTVILFAEKLPTPVWTFRLLMAIVVMTVINFLSFKYSTRVVKILGRTGHERPHQGLRSHHPGHWRPVPPDRTGLDLPISAQITDQGVSSTSEGVLPKST